MPTQEQLLKETDDRDKIIIYLFNKFIEKKEEKLQRRRLDRSWIDLLLTMTES